MGDPPGRPYMRKRCSMKGIIGIISRLRSYISYNRGFTLVEAATVVMITGVMAIVTVPIASEKIEESKTSSARSTVNAIGGAITKFAGDTQVFPTKVMAGGIATNTVQILRSGVGTKADPNADDVLDPFIENEDGSLWVVVNPEGSEVIDNINDHLVNDNQGYSDAGFVWLGPYTPSIDQDPWARNYLVYAKAFYNEIDITLEEKIYAWVLSAGPDKTLQTEPTNSDIKGDDIGVAISTPKSVPGISDNRTSVLQSTSVPSAPPSLEEAP